jgi:hypothetical protein
MTDTKHRRPRRRRLSVSVRIFVGGSQYSHFRFSPAEITGQVDMGHSLEAVTSSIVNAAIFAAKENAS